MSKTAFFTFDTLPAEGTFIIKLTDPDKIKHARDILSGNETKAIHVIGKIVKEPVPYNPNWSFHLDPDSISFFESALEVCDATIEQVEDHLDEACGSFLPDCTWCPWSSRLVKEVHSCKIFPKHVLSRLFIWITISTRTAFFSLTFNQAC